MFFMIYALPNLFLFLVFMFWTSPVALIQANIRFDASTWVSYCLVEIWPGKNVL